MNIFESLSKEERKEFISAANVATRDRNKVISEHLKEVLTMLEGNMKAHHMAWKIPVGNYLINEPTEIAQYLLLKAGESE